MLLVLLLMLLVLLVLLLMLLMLLVLLVEGRFDTRLSEVGRWYSFPLAP
jgi:hypothetical protein